MIRAISPESAESMRVVAQTQHLASGLKLFTIFRRTTNQEILIDYEVQYMESTERTLVLNLDFSGSENVSFFHKGRDSLNTIVEKALCSGTERELVATLQVTDLGKPWTVERKTTWIEKREATICLSNSMSLKVKDHLNRTGKLVAVEFSLILKQEQGCKEIQFDIDFSKSSNLELVLGGLKKSVIVPVNNLGQAKIARLQVIDLNKPWTMNCSYSWEPLDHQQDEVIQESMIEPDMKLIATRSGHAQPSIRYDIVSKKQENVELLLDCTKSSNLCTKSTKELKKTATVRAGERKHIETVFVLDPKKPWSLRSKFFWRNAAKTTPMRLAYEKRIQSIS